MEDRARAVASGAAFASCGATDAGAAAGAVRAGTVAARAAPGDALAGAARGSASAAEMTATRIARRRRVVIMMLLAPVARSRDAPRARPLGVILGARTQLRTGGAERIVDVSTKVGDPRGSAMWRHQEGVTMSRDMITAGR